MKIDISFFPTEQSSHLGADHFVSSLHSSVGRALHRYRRGHGIESRFIGLDFFSGFNFTTVKLTVINHIFISFSAVQTCQIYEIL